MILIKLTVFYSAKMGEVAVIVWFLSGSSPLCLIYHTSRFVSFCLESIHNERHPYGRGACSKPWAADGQEGSLLQIGKELGRSAPTADATSPWIGWIAPINAAPHKSTWLASRSGLDLEAIWLLLCSTDSDKDPTEAQWVHVGPAPTSPPHELFSELLPVPRPIWSRQLMWFTRTLRAGTPKHQVIQHRVCMSICPHVRVIPCTQGCPQQWPLTVYGME